MDEAWMTILRNRPLEKRLRDHLEEPTLGETLEGTLRLAGGVCVRWAVSHRGGYPKKTTGVSQRPLSPILVGLFLSISHPCGMIVQTANLVDSENDNRSRETEGTTCQGLSDQPDCTRCAETSACNKVRPLPSLLYPLRGVRGALYRSPIPKSHGLPVRCFTVSGKWPTPGERGEAMKCVAWK